MAKVKIKTTAQARRAIAKIRKSAAVGDQLEAIARPIFDAAFEDPNEFYRGTLQMGRFTTGGIAGRVGIQIGAAPGIGDRVEAKRGTLARAMARAGL